MKITQIYQMSDNNYQFFFDTEGYESWMTYNKVDDIPLDSTFKSSSKFHSQQVGLIMDYWDNRA